MERVTIDVIRDKLGDFMIAAEYAGTPSIITRYGKDCVVLVSVKEYERLLAAAGE